MPAVRRSAAALLLLVGGAAVGLAALALHALWWGLVLAAAASFAVVWALPARWWTLPPYAVGWWVPLLVGWQPRREGDYALESSAQSIVLIGIAVVVLVSAVFITVLKAPVPGSAPRGGR